MESRSIVRPARHRRKRPMQGGLVVVTGAGSGIGKATARRFAGRGHRVIVSDIDATTAGDTVTIIERAGGTAHAARLDVSDAEAWEAFAVRIRDDHGVPDIVVNAAGIFAAGRFLDHTAEDWQRLLEVNVMGVVNSCRLFGAQMVEQGAGGHLVNVASVASYMPLPFAPAYGATKAGVRMLSESLRIELAGHGIGVTAICPTGIRSNLARNGRVVGAHQESQARLLELTGSLQNRLALAGPDKVARAIERAVERNWAIVPVNPDAWAMYAMSRLSPWLLRRGARVASSEAWLAGARRLARRR
jgi:NAD(P)-dependent dehydrogenase (short-subunit alcohol dehydrogenase family)